MSRQIDDLMSMLVKKLATVVLIRVSKQYSCQIRSTDSETEDLIQVLSLQMITQSKIRLTADDLELFREKKSSILNKSALNSDLSVREKKFSILNESALN